MPFSEFPRLGLDIRLQLDQHLRSDVVSGRLSRISFPSMVVTDASFVSYWAPHLDVVLCSSVTGIEDIGQGLRCIVRGDQRDSNRMRFRPLKFQRNGLQDRHMMCKHSSSWCIHTFRINGDWFLIHELIDHPHVHLVVEVLTAGLG